MLLDRQSLDDAQVLVLRGPVGRADAPQLASAVAEALEHSARGVVVDLTGAETIDLNAWEAVSSAAWAAGSWPRPSLRFCGGPSDGRLRPGLAVHVDRRDALDHLDDRDPGCTEFPVGPGLGAPAEARAAASRWAAELRLGPLVDDVLLVVSELVTNAVRYGSPPLRVSLAADDHTVTVGVVDAASAKPRPREAGADDEGGRGLLLLERLSVQHGVRPAPPGKVVWACLPRS